VRYVKCDNVQYNRPNTLTERTGRDIDKSTELKLKFLDTLGT